MQEFTTLQLQPQTGRRTGAAEKQSPMPEAQALLEKTCLQAPPGSNFKKGGAKRRRGKRAGRRRCTRRRRWRQARQKLRTVPRPAAGDQPCPCTRRSRQVPAPGGALYPGPVRGQRRGRARCRAPAVPADALCRARLQARPPSSPTCCRPQRRGDHGPCTRRPRTLTRRAQAPPQRRAADNSASACGGPNRWRRFSAHCLGLPCAAMRPPGRAPAAPSAQAGARAAGGAPRGRAGLCGRAERRRARRRCAPGRAGRGRPAGDALRGHAVAVPRRRGAESAVRARGHGQHAAVRQAAPAVQRAPLRRARGALPRRWRRAAS